MDHNMDETRKVEELIAKAKIRAKLAKVPPEGTT
jgi:hypothetical protein